ncbi:MAG: helix-turn-helix domain-containing protein [Defluviitaleaceae bacterium]|nr:helix-turn-helix domain-containing protein [Defluviitaleaceae bacterium]
MINDKIKQLRKTLKLNQTDFGRKLGVSRSVIVNIELHKVAPKELFLAHICEVFGASRGWLETGEGDMFTGEKKPDYLLTELLDVFAALKPEFKEYVLQQIGKLLEIQGAR